MDHLKTISIEKYIYLESTASTNAFLTDFISKNNPQHNMCAYTFYQSEGKGQIGRNWFSDVNKNITLSYLVQFNNFDVQNQFNLNMVVSIAVSRFLGTVIDPSKVFIKWPNDIYINDKKVAGILIQNQLKGRKINSSILGIGLNVNQDIFPPGLPNPTSLKIETGREWDKLDLIFNLQNHLCDALNQLSLNAKTLLEPYLKKFYKKDQVSTFIRKDNEETFIGIIKGISAEGKLLVKIGEDLKPFNFRELSFVIDSNN